VHIRTDKDELSDLRQKTEEQTLSLEDIELQVVGSKAVSEELDSIPYKPAKQEKEAAITASNPISHKLSEQEKELVITASKPRSNSLGSLYDCWQRRCWPLNRDSLEREGREKR
jgi:hypothetical protein